MTRIRPRALVAGIAVVALVAIAAFFAAYSDADATGKVKEFGAAIASYFSIDSRAKENRKAAKGPPAVNVTVAQAAQETVPIRVRSMDSVEPYLTVALKARVDGQIVAVNFREGEEVRKGDVLFRVDPRPYEAALRQAQAKALRDRPARSQERRYQELLDKNFISKEAYAQIRTNAETAEATAKASGAALENARLNLDYCTIRSPLSGYVGKVLLQAGNMVRANDVNPLVVINQVRPVYVNFAVPEQKLPEIRKYQAAAPLRADVIPPERNAAPVIGQLVFIDNAVDPSTGTIRLRAQFDNDDA